jgi:hypothetical protein
MGNLGAKFKAWRETGAPAQPMPSRELPLSLARPGWMGFPNSRAPFGEVTKRQPVRWVERPNAKRLPVPTPARVQRASALTKIAGQLPSKLLRQSKTV